MLEHLLETLRAAGYDVNVIGTFSTDTETGLSIEASRHGRTLKLTAAEEYNAWVVRGQDRFGYMHLGSFATPAEAETCKAKHEAQRSPLPTFSNVTVRGEVR